MVVALLTGPGHGALDPAWMPGSDTGDLLRRDIIQVQVVIIIQVLVEIFIRPIILVIMIIMVKKLI